MSKLHLPTLRALAYARATQPSHLEAITVDVDEAETLRLKEEWDRADIPVPLTVVASPYREITRPVVGYVKRLRRESPRDIVTVYIPEYVLGHWWEQILHNQTALRLKARLLQQRGVVVASVPYQLRPSAQRTGTAPGGASWPTTVRTPRRRAPGPTRCRRWRQAAPPAGTRCTPRNCRPSAATGCNPIGDVADQEMADVAGTLRTVTLRPRGPA